MNELDHLEKQLRQSIRALRPARRRWFLSRVALVLVPVATLAGAAGASGLLSNASVASRANDVVGDVTRDTGSSEACEPSLLKQSGTATFSDAAPLPELVRAFPNLKRAPERPVTPALLREAGQAARGATVLRSTIRLATFPDGARILFLATSRGGLFGVSDPAACRTQRLDALNQKKDGLDPAVYARAKSKIRGAGDTDLKAQAFIMSTTRIRTNGLGGGGGASPVRPGHPILVENNWGSGAGGFSAIANRRAAVVRVQRVRPGRGARVWRGDGAYKARIPVSEGLYAFFGRGGSYGRYRVTQYDRAGRVVDRAILPR